MLLAPFVVGSDPDARPPNRFAQTESLKAIAAKLGTIDLNREASFWNTGGPGLGVVHTPVTREVVSRGPSVIPFLIKRLDTSGYNESVYIVFCLDELRAVAAKEKIAELQKDLRANKKFPANGATLYIQTERFLKHSQAFEAGVRKHSMR
jgi:hypothetical protein